MDIIFIHFFSVTPWSLEARGVAHFWMILDSVFQAESRLYPLRPNEEMRNKNIKIPWFTCIVWAIMFSAIMTACCKKSKRKPKYTKRECKICNKEFKTDEQQEEHNLSREHNNFMKIEEMVWNELSGKQSSGQ